MNKNKENNKKKRILWLIIMIICLAAAALSCYMLLRIYSGRNDDFDEYKNGTDNTVDIYETTDITGETSAAEQKKLESYVDFAALQANENPDIHAWIVVPGTKIDYPVVQSDINPEYYLRRDYLGKYDVCGCIFTQYYNKKDFSDPNTVVYGHYMYNKTFFGGLHEFRDAQFFAEHKEFYIWIPGHKLTYEVFAAYEYDDRHILKSFDFNDEAEYEEYLQSCLNPLSVVRNVREGVTLTKEDRIVTLSTCLASGAADKRYLVQGVLRNDELTK